MFKLSGYYIDTEMLFDTEEQAKNHLSEWVSEDKAYGFENTENDYYILEVI